MKPRYLVICGYGVGGAYRSRRFTLARAEQRKAAIAKAGKCQHDHHIVSYFTAEVK